MSIVNAEMESSGRIVTARLSRGSVRKRTFDLIAASVLLMFLFPLMFFVALVLFSFERGPVFFEHERIGYRGKRFRCLKFRSMVVNAKDVLAEHLARNPAARAEWDATQKLKNDPRITAIGRFLRETSLDELPQLINVIRGDMSLVGPRPIVQAEVARYATDISYYESVRPGITGLWQVSGRSDVDYEQRVKLDTRYVVDWSFLSDVQILLKTVHVVFSRTGSY